MAAEFAWGAFTPQQVHTISNLSKRDDERNAKRGVRDALATMGAKGQCRGNMARDIFRQFPKTRLPQPSSFHVPVRHKILGRGNPKLPFLLPHELFSAIYHQYPKAFRRLIAPPGEVERFWEDVKGGHWVLVDIILI